MGQLLFPALSDFESPDKLLRRRRRGNMAGGNDWFGLNPPFDAQYRLVTSGFLPPFWLFFIRLLFAVYTLTSNIVYLILDLTVTREPAER